MNLRPPRRVLTIDGGRPNPRQDSPATRADSRSSSVSVTSPGDELNAGGDGHHEWQQGRAGEKVRVALHCGVFSERLGPSGWAQHRPQAQVRLARPK